MRALWVSLLVCLSCQPPTSLQAAFPSRPPKRATPAFTISTENLLRHLVALTQPQMEGRSVLKEGIKQAEAYIEEEMRAAKLSPLQDGRYTQELKLGELRNIIGVLEPDGLTQKTLVLGAHFDGVVHPAADDNASGVALLLEVARVLSKEKPRGVRVLFCAFTAEERGLWGSEHFASRYAGLRQIDFMFNFDMVGRVVDDTLYLGGTTKPLEALLAAVSQESGLSIQPSLVETTGADSDHSSFIRWGVPAIHFFSGLHPDIHTPSDTLDKIDVASMGKVAGFVIRVVYKLEL